MRSLPPITLTQSDHDRLSDIAETVGSRAPGGRLLRERVVAPGEIAPSVVTMNAEVEFVDNQTRQVRASPWCIRSMPTS